MTGPQQRISSGIRSGDFLGHYRIEEHIGEGGMGVVYRATDTSLRRNVAIKVLPDHCANDPEKRARFQREAHMLAALNHPHVAAIHGFETQDSLCFLVLEYVPGQTLAEVVSGRRVPLAEALRINLQIAEALEAAHDRGIIHRDLKPANVKITAEGTVKVLDFGLARTFDGGATSEETATLAAGETRPGVVLGTAAYMSPEQARAMPVDRRTDVWAFGCVLFELLTGTRAFPGATGSDCLAAVLTRDPDWSALPADVPPGIVKLLKRCLQKDVRNRLRDIGDARIEIEEVLTGGPERQPAPRHATRRTLAVAVAGVLIGGILIGAASLLLRPESVPRAVTRFSIPLPAEQVISPSGVSVRLSRDGTKLAWVAADVTGRSQIYTRSIDDFNAKVVENTTGASSPSFSPDGAWIAYTHPASRTIRRIALSGGAPVTVASYEAASMVNWTAPDEILTTIQYPGSVVKIPASGGKPQPLTKLDTGSDERVHNRPILLPGGKAMIYMAAGGGMDTYDDGKIFGHVFATGERKLLIEGGMSPAYVPGGYLIYARQGRLLAVSFDAERLEVTGSPVPVVDGVFMCVNTGAAHYSISDHGTLAYAPGLILGGRRELVWVDRRGTAEVIPAPARAYLHPRLSPDDKNLAVEIEGPVHDFWMWDFGRGVMTKVTTEGSSHWPVWTPDGTRVSYRRWLDGYFSMWWLPADRSTGPERLTDVGRMQSPASWSPDGRVVAFTQISPSATGADIFVMDVSNRTPRSFVQTRFTEGAPRFSSDGRWIAYTSNESGRNEIYAQQYPGPGAKIQLSTEGGTDAVWRRQGGELYYRDGDKMMMVQVNTTAPTLQASKPRVLWTGKYGHGMGSACGPPGTTSSNYDVTADGSRFLMIRHEEIAPVRINVVVNWTEELQRLRATTKL